VPSADRSARHHINALTQLLKYIPRSIVNAAAIEHGVEIKPNEDHPALPRTPVGAHQPAVATCPIHSPPRHPAHGGISSGGPYIGSSQMLPDPGGHSQSSWKNSFHSRCCIRPCSPSGRVNAVGQHLKYV
jgi:hypothetical protein